MSNRYSRIATSRFDPLSLQEIMAVPLARQQQHDNTLKSIDELGLFDLNRLQADEEAADGFINEYTSKLQSKADQILERGVDQSTVREMMKLKSERDNFLLNDGKKMEAAYNKRMEDEKIIKSMIGKDGMTAMRAQEILDYGLKNYKGFKEGEYNSYYGAAEVDAGSLADNIGRTMPDNIVSSHSDLTPITMPNGEVFYQYSDTEVASKDPLMIGPNGSISQAGLVRKNIERRLMSNPQLQADIAHRKNIDPNFNEKEYLEPIINNAEEVWQAVQEKSRTGYMKGATPKVASENEVEDGSVGTLNLGIKKYGSTAGEVVDQISKYNNDIKNLNKESPYYERDYNNLLKERRERENILYESKDYAYDSLGITDSDIITKENVLSDPLVSQKTNQIKQLEEKFLKENPDKKWQLEQIQNSVGEDLLFDDASFEGTGYLTGTKRDLLMAYEDRNNVLISNPTRKAMLKQQEDIGKLQADYISSNGREETGFSAYDKAADISNFNKNLKTLLKDSTLNISDIKGIDDGKVKQGMMQNGNEYNSQLKRVMSASKIETALFKTDGNRAMLEIDFTPEESVEFDNSLFDYGVDFNESESQSVTIDLIDYSNKKTPELTTFAVNMLNNSNLSNNVKQALRKQIFTSLISATNNKEKIGESRINPSKFIKPEVLNKMGINQGDTIDFYKPSRDPYLHIYKVSTDGSKSPIKANSLFGGKQDIDSLTPLELQKIRSIVPTYRDWMENTSIESVKKNNPELYKNFFDDTYNPKAKIATVFNALYSDPQKRSKEMLNAILKMDLIIDGPSNIMDLNN